MSCKSIFVNLGGGGGGSINTGVLQIAGGVALDSTLRFVETQNGTDSLFKLATNKAEFYLSAAASIKVCDGGNFLDFSDGAAGYIRYGLNAAIGIKFGGGNSTVLFGAGAGNPILLANSASVDIGIGTITNNGVLTVKGAGGNIVSLRNSSNVEQIVFQNNGGASFNDDVVTRAAAQFRLLGHLKIFSPGDGIAIITNNAGSNFDRLQLGGSTASFPSIKRSGINIEVRQADDNGYGGITAGRSTEKTLEVLEVSGAMGLGFFNTPAINQPTTAIGEATYVSSGGGGSQIRTDDTIGGYTMQQVVQALQNLGLLA